MTADNKMLIAQDGNVEYLPNFLGRDEANELFAQLAHTLAWQDEWITLGARRLQVPRQVCWYGDPGASYQYSAVQHAPLPWTPALASLRERAQVLTGQPFNSVLGNYYKSGQDSMGWHADREVELGRNPYIASLSLGGERLFKLRHVRSGATVNIVLGSGSLLLMHGALQHYWRHSLPKTKRAVAPRINLTFRRILHSASTYKGKM